MLSGDEDMRRYASAIVMLVVLCSLAVSGRAMIADKGEIPDLPSISPEGHQPIRASVLDHTPSHFTIDVRKFANIGVDENATTFALYLGTRLPKRCGDFRDVDLAYWKPSKYKRVFNLSGKDKVLSAIENYHCIVLRNAPPTG
jgi:hypothetical protein